MKDKLPMTSRWLGTGSYWLFWTEKGVNLKGFYKRWIWKGSTSGEFERVLQAVNLKGFFKRWIWKGSTSGEFERVLQAVNLKGFYKRWIWKGSIFFIQNQSQIPSIYTWLTQYLFTFNLLFLTNIFIQLEFKHTFST